MTEEERQLRIEIGRSAKRHIANNDPTGWFEDVYALAENSPQHVPWAFDGPNPQLVAWLDRENIEGAGKTALVTGCGLGDDAEELAKRGFKVTAFDIAPTAIEWVKKRFPDSKVDYQIADLLAPPSEWIKAFDLVTEVYTVQPLPLNIRQAAIEATAQLVAPNGTVIVICFGRDDNDANPQGPPWPMARAELNHYHNCELTELSFEDYGDDEDPPMRRFRAAYKRST